MRSKRRLFAGSTVCVIIDRGLVRTDSAACRVACGAVRGGARIIQYRDKRTDTATVIAIARRLRRIAARHRAAFVMNDRPDIALAAGADGVHVGRGDADQEVARVLLGSERIVGVTASRTGTIRRAARDGADYVGVGPCFATPIKRAKRPLSRRSIRRLRHAPVPVVAIGGITAANTGSLADLGIRHIAVIRAVTSSPDPYRAAQRLCAALRKKT